MSLLDKLRERKELKDKIEAATANSVSSNPVPAPPIALRLRERVQVTPSDTSSIYTPKLAERLEAARKSAFPTGYVEVGRIVQLPIVDELTKAEFEAYCEDNILAETFRKGWRFFPPQAEALLAYEMYSGLMAPIGVGWGKTLISLGIAERAYRKGLRKILLLVPPEVYLQLVKTDIPWARSKIPLTVPLHGMGLRSREYRRMMAHSNKKGCYILPYSCLSTKDTSEVLEKIQPQLIIGDEVHKLKNRQAARTKRLLTYLRDRFEDGHETEFVGMSGTVTAKSIRDYHHLIKAALGPNCPLPLSTQMASDWSIVIDTNASPSRSQTGPLRPLVEWARKNYPNEDFPITVPGFRKAFKLRLNTAPGVVATGDTEIGTSIIISNRPIIKPEAFEGWSKLEGLMDKVVDEWITPTGDEIEHAIHTWKWLYELSAGFYNELYWPEPEQVAIKFDIDIDEAKRRLKKAQIHHTLKQDYHRTLRHWLDAHSRAGLDTPMLVALDMSKVEHRNVGTELYEAYKAMKDAEFEDMPERLSRAIRICPFKIDAAAEWASKLGKQRNGDPVGAIIWVHHKEMGQWCYEALLEAGINALHCPAGNAGNRAILDPENGNKVIVASMTAHGTGKNLQHFQKQYFLQWPRPATTAEQTLGRTHRNGQEADELIVSTNWTTEFDYLNFAACLNDSLYIHQTTGTRQKLVYCGYDPLPPIFPPEVLKERGFQPKMLSGEQRHILDMKFTEN
ncbi:MAG: DEAD/DEAH box helicase family protein [bacterium]|nr:DEAD/DEAH box helicase family protein [bacterium]